MRRLIRLFAATAVVLGVVDCGADTTGVATTDGAMTTTTVVTPADLESLLLTADEINDRTGGEPAWQVQVLSDPSGGSFTSPCDDAQLDPDVVERLTAATAADASRSDGNASMLEVLVTGEERRLLSDVRAYLDAQSACEAAPSGSASTSPARTLVLPDLGQLQWAEVGVCPGWAADSRGYEALVLSGSVLIRLASCEQPVATGDDLMLTDDIFVELVRAAAERIAD